MLFLYMYFFLAHFISAFTLYDFPRLLSTILLLKDPVTNLMNVPLNFHSKNR